MVDSMEKLVNNALETDGKEYLQKAELIFQALQKEKKEKAKQNTSKSSGE